MSSCGRINETDRGKKTYEDLVIKAGINAQGMGSWNGRCGIPFFTNLSQRSGPG